MKYLIFVFFFLSISFNLISQESETIKKWRFGLELSPNLTQFILSAGHKSFEEYLPIFKENQTSKFCFGGQLFASNYINKKSSISIGIGYQNIGNIYSADDYREQSIYNYHNIKIPLSYSYFFTKKMFARTGISPVINILNTVKTENISSAIEPSKKERLPNEEFRGINYSYELSFGFVFYSSTSIDLYTQVNAETTLLKINPYGIIQQRPVSLGLVLGVKF